MGCHDIEESTMHWKRLFSAFAHNRPLSEMSNFINNRHYLMPIPGLKDFYESEVLHNKEKKALDLLTEPVIALLEKGLE